MYLIIQCVISCPRSYSLQGNSSAIKLRLGCQNVHSNDQVPPLGEAGIETFVNPLLQLSQHLLVRLCSGL